MAPYPLYPMPSDEQLPPSVHRPPRPSDRSRPYIAEPTAKYAFEAHCATLEALTSSLRTIAPLNGGPLAVTWDECFSAGYDENFKDGARVQKVIVANSLELEVDEAYLDAKDEEDLNKEALDSADGIESPAQSSVADRILLSWIDARLKDENIQAFCKWAKLHEQDINAMLVDRSMAKTRKLYRQSREGRVLCKDWDWECRKIGTAYLDSFIRNGVKYPHQNLTAVLFVILGQDHEYVPKENGIVDLSRARAALRSKKLVDSSDVGTVIYALLVGEFDILTKGTLVPTYIGMSQNAWKRYRQHVNKPINSRMSSMMEKRNHNDLRMHIVLRLPSETPVPIQHLLEHYLIAYHESANPSKQGLNVNALDWLLWATLIVGSTLLRLVKALNLTLQAYPDQRVPLDRDVDAWHASLRPHLPADMTELPRSIGQMVLGATRKYVWRVATKEYIQTSLSRELKMQGVNNVGEYKASDRFLSGRPRSEAWIEAHPGEFFEVPSGPFCSRAALVLFIQRLAEGFAQLADSDA